MEDKEVKIFTSDIEVPAVVQKKADAAFAQIKKERMDAMNEQKRDTRTESGKKKILKYLKPVIAAAACAALIAGGVLSVNVGKDYDSPDFAVNSKNNGEQVLEEATQGNPFVLTVYAKELEPGNPIPLVLQEGGLGRAYVFGGNEEGNVNYCINTDFSCQGENIERVGYSVDHGAFQIIQPIDPEDRIVVEGQIYNGELNTGSIGGGYEENPDVQPELYETVLYQSFILDYDRQNDENTWINICNEIADSGEIMDLIWGAETSLERENEGINKMLDHVIITCTAYYSDGTAQSVDIEVGSRVMTYEEAGEPSGKGEIPQDTKGTFITFEVK